MSYDKEKFDVTVRLNAKIHAYAYVGPQLTIDILDFNLLTVQAWVGFEGDAVVDAEAQAGDSGNGMSMKMDLKLDFVVLVRAWVFNKKWEYYLVDVTIYQKTFQYKTGQMVSQGSGIRNISPVIRVDGACVYRDAIWGSVYYEEMGELVDAVNIPVDIKITRKDGTCITQTVNTNELGAFELKYGGGIYPTDLINVSIHHTDETDSNNKVIYTSVPIEPITPSIPFQINLTEVDGFNDTVVGMISPSKPSPREEGEEYYQGTVTVTVLDENGKVIRTKSIQADGQNFSVKFSKTQDLSGGHTAYASLTFEGTKVTSNKKEADLAALKFFTNLTIDHVPAEDIYKYREDNEYVVGILADQVEYGGTITNQRGTKSYEGNVTVTVNDYSVKMPVNVIYKNPIESFGIAGKKITGISSDGLNSDAFTIDVPNHGLDAWKTGISVFEDSYDSSKILVMSISFMIEYEGMQKTCSYSFDNSGNSNITAVNTNPIDQILTDVIDSRINPAELVLTVGSSQMLVRGMERAIDGRANTSVMQVGGATFIPMKAVVSALGGTATVTKGSTITIKLNGKTIMFTVGSKSIKQNGLNLNMKTAPFSTVNGTVMMPAQMLNDYFGYQTVWNSKLKTFTVKSVGKAKK